MPDPTTLRRPSVIVFDVNETLADLSPLAARFVEVGAPASLASLWFASLLRDGFALTVTGDDAPFAEVGEAVLRPLLDGVALTRPPDEAVAHVLAGFAALEPHADVPHGLRLLAEAGFRLVTLSNGAAEVAETLLTEADLREHVEQVLSVEDAGAWKPHRDAYAYAAKVCGTDPAGMLMVAVHPWDLHGAARAGLATAWVDRSGTPYPATFAPPTYTVAGVEQLAELLTGEG